MNKKESITEDPIQKSSTGNKKKSPSTKITFTIIVLILAAASIAWLLKDQIHFSITHNAKPTLHLKIKQLNKQLTKQNTTIKTLQESLKQQSSLSQQQSNSIYISQIYYLVKTAKLELSTQQDLPQALQNLQLALELTNKTVALPKIGKLKIALDDDINNLQHNQIDNKYSITNQLESIIDKLEQLKRPGQISKIKANKKKVESIITRQENAVEYSEGPLNMWHKIAGPIVKSFQAAVVIRHIDSDTKPLLTQEQTIILLTQMQCHLLLAENSLFNNHPKLFTRQIKSVRNNFNHHFNQYPNAISTQIIKQLTTLEKSNLKKNQFNLQLSEQAIDIVMQSLP